jgi:hypothetical protein
MYALRSFLVALLLAGVSIVWLQKVGLAPTMSMHAQASIGEYFSSAVIALELTLILLIAPATTAGAICLDRTRGALLPVFITDLTAWEIVVGKLAAQLLPLLVLAGCSVPVLFLCMPFGGIDVATLVRAALVTIGVAVFGATLALALSVWGKTPGDVVFASYLLISLVFFSDWIWATVLSFWSIRTGPTWLSYLNPYWVTFGSATTAPNPWRAPLQFCAGCLLASGVLVFLMTIRLRAVTVRRASQIVSIGRLGRIRARFIRPLLDRDPIVWRELRRGTAGHWRHIAWGIYAGLLILLPVVLWAALPMGLARGLAVGIAPGAITFVTTVGLFFVTIETATSAVEERVRGILDVLLCTPLSTRAILWGKWKGAYWTVPLIALGAGSVAGVLAGEHGRWRSVAFVMGLVLACGAVVTTMGFYFGATLRRFDRAALASTTIYVFGCLAWPPLLYLVCRPWWMKDAATLLVPMICLAAFATTVVWLARTFAVVNRAAFVRVMVYLAIYGAWFLFLVGSSSVWVFSMGRIAWGINLASLLVLAVLAVALIWKTASVSTRYAKELSAYLVWGLTWAPLLIASATRINRVEYTLLMASPWCWSDGMGWDWYWIAAAFWIVTYTAIACLLFRATQKAFDQNRVALRHEATRGS